MFFPDRSTSDVIIAVNVVLCITSITSAAVRFQKPGAAQRGLDLQMGMLAMATICGLITSIMQCVATRYGLGSHITTLGEANTNIFFSQLYPVIMVFYYACNTFVKFALLIFYLRITYERKHLYAIWAMIFVAFGFGLSNIFVTVFQCVPFKKIWNPTLPGHCVQVMAFYYANSCIMIANDAIMYLMPMVFTKHLALRLPQRIVLNLLFALGAVVVLTSILRLLALIEFDRSGGSDMTFHLARILLWSAIENHTAIFIACSPSIKALVIGTLVPMVSSVSTSVSEKVKTLKSSSAGTSTFGLSSQTTTIKHDSAYIQQQVPGNALLQSPRRVSMESDNSRFGLTREHRLGSYTSYPGSLRVGSNGTLYKGGAISTVIPLDDLEAQSPISPQSYHSFPKRDSGK